MNHYYDPIYNEGWQGEQSGYLPDWFTRSGAYAVIIDKMPLSSLDWMRNQETQTAYNDFGGNRTWDRALYEMAVNNNEKEAYYTLGFVLHLMEDSAVPDHTRNDSHAPGIGGDEGSPYEQYADRFTRENFNVAMDLRNAGYEPIEKNTVDHYLHSLALYSNKNFFSKDTVFDEKYEEPKIVTEWEIGGHLYGIGQEDNGIKFPLVKIDLFQTRTGIQKNYTLLSSKQSKAYELILQDYFTLLSRQAIINGAGVINLFRKEAEKAKKNPENLIPPPELKMANRAVSLFGEIEKNGVYEGVANAFETAMKKYAIYKPTNFAFNLVASAINVLKEIDEVDTKKLATGYIALDDDDEDDEIASSLVALAPRNDENDEIGTRNNNEEIDVEIAYDDGEDVDVGVPTPAPTTINVGGRISDIPVADPDDEIRDDNRVKWVIDGDTLTLNDNTKVRLIGIDAPEEGECFYGESKGMLMDLVLDKNIILEKDISDTDKYGRLLRYIRINDILVNDYMVREGYAEEWAYGSDIKYREQLTESQVYAEENNLGLWDKCLETEKNTPTTSGGSGSNSLVSSIGNNNLPSEPELEPEDEPEDEPEPELEPEDTTPPQPPIITTNNGEDFIATTTPIVLSGTMSDDTDVILLNASSDGITMYDASWDSLTILSEGVNILNFTAQDVARNESSADTITITLDSMGPVSEITVSNYNVMSTTFNVGWLATEEDVATTTYEPQYKIGASGNWQNLTIENGDEFEAEQDQTTYYFRVRVKDTNGNQGDWSEIAEAEINTKPVIFNEIAWMGTEASAYDEWIELYNTSGQDVDITNWQILANDWNPDITIQNASDDTFTIKANDYFLLERTNDSTVSNIEADFLYTGTLHNDGEILRLKDSASNTGNVIDQINSWYYAGDNDTKRTMERVRSNVGSDVSANWLTYEGEGGEAQDADGEPILGTPKSQNSVHNKHYAIGGNITEDTIFYKSNTPYFIYSIYSGLSVSTSTTLTIEAGVEIKIADKIQIDINGTLNSQGSATENISFTSSNAIPAAGDWAKIYFSPKSQNSQLTYTNISYGGSWTRYSSGESAAIEVATSTVAFNNVYVNESEYRGIWLKNSNSTIHNSTFDNISNIEVASAMIEINGGNPEISGSTFQNTNDDNNYSSYYGINILNGVNPIISDNSFSNTKYPIHITRGDPVLSGNIGFDNLHNGIGYDTGYEINDNTVLEKDLPYLIDSMLQVKNGATLTINAGAELRFNIYGGWGDGIEIQDGTIKAIGTSDNRIKFTNANITPWRGIKLTAQTNSESEFKYVTMENGGYANSGDGAMLEIEGVAINIDNVEIKNSEEAGILLNNSDSTITNSLFECNASSFEICGGGSYSVVGALDIQNSNPTVSDTIFNSNRIGIKSVGDSNPTFSNITFGTGDDANFMDTDPENLIP